MSFWQRRSDRRSLVMPPGYILDTTALRLQGTRHDHEHHTVGTGNAADFGDDRSSVYVRRMVLKRSALPTTETELKPMAAAAIIGLRSR